MPSIEITQEQADALARGENVTLSPDKKRVWLVLADKCVFRVTSPTRPKVGELVANGQRDVLVLNWEGRNYRLGDNSRTVGLIITEVRGELEFAHDGTGRL